MWKRLWEKLKSPSKSLLALTYVLTAVCIAGALTLLIVGKGNPGLELLSYIFYALAAVTLAYTVYTLVKILPNVIREIKQKLREHRLTGKLMKSYGFRTLIFACCSTVMTVAYAIYNGVIALMRFLPVWHGALAAYYILLACMRGGVLLYHGKRVKGQKEREETVEIKKYRNCGILLIVLIISLSAAILQMVQEDAGFGRPGLMIYVAATYTFVKVTTAAVNFIKAKKHNDFTVEALRNVNVADAAVSLLALQTSMFFEFGNGASTGFANAVTGAAVCLVVFTLGVYMIVKGQKKLKEEKEKGYGKRA